MQDVAADDEKEAAVVHLATIVHSLKSQWHIKMDFGYMSTNKQYFFKLTLWELTT